MLKQDTYLLPTTQAFNNLYHSGELHPAIKDGSRASVIQDSHVQNGVIVTPGAASDLFSLRRGAFCSMRWRLCRRPVDRRPRVLRTPGRRRRNYGIVMADPLAKDRVVLVAGTHTMSIASDMIAGKAGSDPWGNIERHVTVYHFKTNQVTQRFLGSAHDDNDHNQYQNRVVHPAHVAALGRTQLAHCFQPLRRRPLGAAHH